MGRLADLLEDKTMKLEASPNLIIDESFMLGMLSCFDEETPPFVECKGYLRNNKSQCSIVGDQEKYQPHQLIANELFDFPSAS